MLPNEDLYGGQTLHAKRVNSLQGREVERVPKFYPSKNRTYNLCEQRCIFNELGKLDYISTLPRRFSPVY